ncbi:hypothetical protein KUTeg_004751 [Tegillarca granosa]|uniref:Uncharacterized protein n=1 Tax=Tegillarca granosa TaxID=220873 RepID=A0ABQ9FJW5_TEGGR|nr:hypothetical protein KUTeg_004751 [Tegillarca granosa]
MPEKEVIADHMFVSKLLSTENLMNTSNSTMYLNDDLEGGTKEQRNSIYVSQLTPILTSNREDQVPCQSGFAYVDLECVSNSNDELFQFVLNQKSTRVTTFRHQIAHMMSDNENIILENDLIGETSNPGVNSGGTSSDFFYAFKLFKTYFDGKITNLQNGLSI